MPTAPFEIVSGPITLYTGLVGAALPEISDPPPTAAWTVLGTSGDENYSEEGVVIDPQQNLSYQRVLGSTADQKAYRDAENPMISVTLIDLSAEAFAFIMNNGTVTTVAAGSGTGGYRSFPLMRGFDVHEFAVLARGYSPYADDMAAQYWIPRCVIETVGPASYVKADGAAHAIDFHALEHATGGLGGYYAQDADPT